MTVEHSELYLHPRTAPPTALLLLDVENFNLKIDLEKYLKAYCIYPITIKLAVANWQNNSISNLDLYLHKQKYQLIHVPKDKNAADAQIMTLGISCLTQYPQIKEVVIVSHDSIFDYLHKSLMTFGCRTYKVFQQSGNVHVHNQFSDRTDIIKVESNTATAREKAHSPEKKLISKIESIIVKNSGDQREAISINSLSQEYKKKYNLTLSQAIKQEKLGSSIIKFLENNCTNKINIQQKDNIHYLSLK